MEEKKVDEKKPTHTETPVVEEKKTEPLFDKSEAGEGKKKCGWKGCNFKMKTGTAIAIAGVIIALALAFYCRGIFIAATVDGSPIGRLSVIGEAEKQVGKATLDNLILKKIVQNEVARKGVTVSDAEVSAEISKIETMIKGQGGTLDQALASQGITKAELVEQITLQKKVEKLLPTRPIVTDEEVSAYISANKISLPKGSEAPYLAEMKSQMEQQKLNDAISALVASLKAKATIQYFVKY
jgi:hypothetical protein